MSELRTERTRLVPFRPEDAPELMVLFRDPAIRRYLLDDRVVPAVWVQEEIAASTRRFGDSGAGLWTVRGLEGDGVIGFVGFREFFEPPQLQLIYGLHPDRWGRGLATEVARAVCEHAFQALGFGEVRAALDSPHQASRRVLERLGFLETHRTGHGAHGTTFFRLGRDSLAEARDQG